MAYAATIDIVAGDNLPGIQFTIKDKNNASPGGFFDKKDSSTWANVDLTNATVKAAFRRLGEVTVSEEAVLSVVDPSTGRVLLSLANTQFNQIPGTYEVEITVEYVGDGQQTVYDWMRIEVRERF